MNIFILDKSIDEAVRFHCDKHVVKMPLETVQMLCTVQWTLGNTAPYKPVHQKHPCTLWAGKTRRNYSWLWVFGLALCQEYSFRYGRKHKCVDVLYDLDLQKWNDLPEGDLTPFYQAMPDEYKHDDPVVAYRRYYQNEKAYFAKWTNRPTPTWMESYVNQRVRVDNTPLKGDKGSVLKAVDLSSTSSLGD